MFIENAHATHLGRLYPVTVFLHIKKWLTDSDNFIQPILKSDKFSEPYNEGRQQLPKIFQQDGFIDKLDLKYFRVEIFNWK